MDLINSHAIVAYVAGPIAWLADRLRDDLNPHCPHQAHITILPPRPLLEPAAEAIEFARQMVAKFEPVSVEVCGVEVFATTQVIYLALAAGAVELTAMHDVLNTGLLEQEEVFDYVPHITLGKELPADLFDRFLNESRRRWRELPHPGLQRIDTVTFVQQRIDGSWTDLAELGLGRVRTAG